MMQILLHKLQENKNIATIILVVMVTQNVFLESYDFSPIKISLMAFMPVVLLLKVPYVSKSLIWGGFYLLSIIIVALLHGYIRISTLGYTGLFVITSITYYNLIQDNAFTLDYYIKILKYIILAYFVCLICQQIFILLGLRFFPVINFSNQTYLAINKLPSLSVEPSHSARILTALMFGYLKCNEFKQGYKISLRQLFSTEHKWVFIGFLWTMVTMGSGTAFLGIGILLIYFISFKNVIYIIPFFVIIFILLSQMNIEQLDRVIRVVNATLTGDVQAIRMADGSASVRVLPVLNTFKTLDLNKVETWIGVGTTTFEYNSTSWRRDDAIIGTIEQYGLFTYIISLVFLYNCFIRKILSIETLIFIILVGCNLSNIYYIWGILFIFCGIKHFEQNDQKYENNSFNSRESKSY